MFDYDPGAGAITNRVSRTSRRAGERAETPVHCGYRWVTLGGARYYAHRVAWTLAYGVEPSGFIDHINGDRADNRLCNLRCATHSENLRNRGIPCHNTSGIKGVSWEESSKTWRASIGVNRKRIYLGRFAKKGDAAKAVADARSRLHGDFARTS